MTARTLMIQGTSSSVGKSLIVAGLCRFYARAGLRVAPFKAQNMALNSYVAADGGEMGRAQVVQAQAAGILPTVDMNPILLKPEAAARSQLIVRGRVQGHLASRDFLTKKAGLWPIVTQALDRLRAAHDLVVIEGAGSPAEINLKAGDIVNMRVARYAGSPVILVGDIDRGGVFAALLGTLLLLTPEEQALVRGFLINKFRGDLGLLTPGLEMIEQRTNRPVLGVIPYLSDPGIAEEDSVVLEQRRDRPLAGSVLDIAIVQLPHVANFDDFDPLEQEPGIGVRWVTRVADLGRPDLLILPGTKTTVHDLGWLRSTGLAAALETLVADGVPMVGICGGYQMLGRTIWDPDRVEADIEHTPGLSLLPVDTRFVATKHTYQVQGTVAPAGGLLAGLAGTPITGYEIHLGETTGPVPPAFRLSRRLDHAIEAPEGAIGPTGTILGTYLHGVFHNRAFRRGLLGNLAGRTGRQWEPALTSTGDPYDRLADLIEAAVGRDRLLALPAIGPAG